MGSPCALGYPFEAQLEPCLAPWADEWQDLQCTDFSRKYHRLVTLAGGSQTHSCSRHSLSECSGLHIGAFASGLKWGMPLKFGFASHMPLVRESHAHMDNPGSKVCKCAGTQGSSVVS
jgi:hypothetical protein